MKKMAIINKTKTTILAGALGLIALPQLGLAYGGEEYIRDAQARLKPGVYNGKSGSGACTVRVTLSTSGGVKQYTVEISPTLSSYATDNGPTVISFSSNDTRVLSNDRAAHAVSNKGDDYLVLGLKPVKGGTFVRAYVKRGQSLKTAECTI